MKKIDTLRKERDQLLGLMDHGKKTGQADGSWYEGLEARFDEVEREIGKELKKLEPQQRIKSIMGSW